MISVRLLLVAAISCLASGCSRESEEMKVAREIYWMAPDGGLAAHVGSFSDVQVHELASAWSRVTFPVPEREVADIMPRTPKPKVVTHWDDFAVDERGRVGGLIEDYWLNADAVFRIATGYYVKDGHHVSQKDSAELLSAREAYTRDVMITYQKAAQPGATDNPDDAQRLREDH